MANGSGDVETFSLGSDGTIWNFYPDPTSESGYNGVSLGLQATTFAVGRDSDGRLVLFYSSVLQLSYVKETGLAASRWSAPVNLSYPTVPAPRAAGGSSSTTPPASSTSACSSSTTRRAATTTRSSTRSGTRRSRRSSARG